ncbi:MULTISPECIES: hypothetical protein [unclassified Rhizobium]|uniref:hypothetical protein n=1 Tax=unclassified Rhizobium TaxID=2613769 RepID=UPI001052209F|nr:MULTISPECIES: hypothetical protein [unclassified Rhizobium]MBB4166903.1 hypothetical protein [Rhizobium sp. BK538]TCM67134.1 hypothetical protein EV291_13655 [Rhizobium sp. BK068]
MRALVPDRELAEAGEIDWRFKHCEPVAVRHQAEPAEDLAKTKPNPMINGHQDWLDGPAGAARRKAKK